MSISDELMWRYYDLISGLSIDEVTALKKSVTLGENPRDIKRKLAHLNVTRFHDTADADDAQASFIAQFSNKGLPSDIETVTLTAQQQSMPLGVLLRDLKMTQSSSEGNRLIKQGAVKLDNQVITELPALGAEHILQVGKRRIIKLVT